MEGDCKTVKLGGMLGVINEMRTGEKWGVILDCQGNVSTFMKYKANYHPGWE